jgi:hypothetical protein
MKHYVLLLLVVVFAALLPSRAAGTPPAGAPLLFTIHAAGAVFEAVDLSDSTGCTSLSAFLAPAAYHSLAVGDEEQYESATISITRFNTCTGQTLFWASDNPAMLDKGTFSERGNLTSATLVGTATLLEQPFYTPVTVELNVTWTADPGSAVLLQNALYAQATAQGTVIFDGTNFAPAPTDDANMALSWFNTTPPTG